MEEKEEGAWWRLYEWSKAWCLSVLLGKRWCWRPGRSINWSLGDRRKEESGEWELLLLLLSTVFTETDVTRPLCDFSRKEESRHLRQEEGEWLLKC